MKTVKKHNNRSDISGVSAAEFAAAVTELFPENTLPEKIAIGVSGGADSMALTLLLADYAKETGRQLTALTVNHNLRAAAKTKPHRRHTFSKNAAFPAIFWTGSRLRKKPPYKNAPATHVTV